MRPLVFLFAITLTGCPKGRLTLSPGLVSSSKWVGEIRPTGPCETSAPYSGEVLQTCIIFRGTEPNAIRADIDWDTSSLRTNCDYFEFTGLMSPSQILLEQNDASTRVILTGNENGALVGTFEVLPECGQWPIILLPEKR